MMDRIVLYVDGKLDTVLHNENPKHHKAERRIEADRIIQGKIDILRNGNIKSFAVVNVGVINPPETLTFKERPE